MKIANRITLLAGLLMAAQSAFAHDPAMHAAEAAATKAGPNCSAMTEMDMSKMDMNDPTMQALHMKCMKAQAPTGAASTPMDHGSMPTMDHSKMPGMGGDKPMAMPEHGGH